MQVFESRSLALAFMGLLQVEENRSICLHQQTRSLVDKGVIISGYDGMPDFRELLLVGIKTPEVFLPRSCRSPSYEEPPPLLSYDEAPSRLSSDAPVIKEVHGQPLALKKYFSLIST